MLNSIDLLRRTGLFANLDAPQLESLAQRMRVHLYPAEQIIFEEGSPGDEFFIITEGKVAITKKVGDDLEILAVLGPDRFFGEMALLEDAPRGAGAVSRTEVGVLTLNRDDLYQAILEHPDILWRLTPTLSHRLRDTSDRLAETMHQAEAQKRELREACLRAEATNTELRQALKRHSYLRRLVMIIVLLAGLGVSGAALRLHGSFNVTTKQTVSSAVPSDGQTMEITPQSIKSSITASGKLAPLRILQITSSLSTQILDSEVMFGEYVEKGHPLLHLDTARAEADLRQAQSQLIKAQSSYEERRHWNTRPEVANARRSAVRAAAERDRTARTLESSSKLFAQGIISHSELEQAESLAQSAALEAAAGEDGLKALEAQGSEDYIRIARFDVENAQQAVTNLQTRLAAAAIVAPSAGVVLKPQIVTQMSGNDEPSALVPGRQISEGTVLLSIGDMSGLSIQATVDEFDVSKVQPGQKITVHTDATDGTWEGVVRSVSSQPLSGTEGSGQLARYALIAEIPSISESDRTVLRLGMSATIDIEVRSAATAIMVPISSIIQNGEHAQVWRRDTSGKPVLITVHLGQSQPEGIEVTDGLTAGDVIWINPPQ